MMLLIYTARIIFSAYAELTEKDLSPVHLFFTRFIFFLFRVYDIRPLRARDIIMPKSSFAEELISSRYISKHSRDLFFFFTRNDFYYLAPGAPFNGFIITGMETSLNTWFSRPVLPVMDTLSFRHICQFSINKQM